MRGCIVAWEWDRWWRGGVYRGKPVVRMGGCGGRDWGLVWGG